MNKEDVNRSSKGQAIFTPLHDQDTYPGEEEDLESNDYLKPSTSLSILELGNLSWIFSITPLEF